jgi:dipeptidyl aminopeptidase/acylaminoacyl peptidase
VWLESHDISFRSLATGSNGSVGWVFQAVFSLDDTKMAIAWNRKDQGLWIISLKPYSETLLQAGRIYPVGWSPDGKYVYATRADTGYLGREIIRVQVASPNEVTSVATLPADVLLGSASVSPDGKEIVVSISEEKSDVWLMENFDPSPR